MTECRHICQNSWRKRIIWCFICHTGNIVIYKLLHWSQHESSHICNINSKWDKWMVFRLCKKLISHIEIFFISVKITVFQFVLYMSYWYIKYMHDTKRFYLLLCVIMVATFLMFTPLHDFLVFGFGWCALVWFLLWVAPTLTQWANGTRVTEIGPCLLFCVV